MKEFFGRIRLAVYLSSIITIASGITLLIWPMEVTGLICRIFGILLMILGAVQLLGYFMEGAGKLSVAGGMLFTLLGVWIFMHPASVAQLVPIGIGVVMMMHSLRDFQMAFEAKQNGSRRWGTLFFLALLNCVFGIACICDSFGVLSVAVRVLGLALVYNGIADMVIAHYTMRAAGAAAAKSDPIDVESHDL